MSIKNLSHEELAQIIKALDEQKGAVIRCNECGRLLSISIGFTQWIQHRQKNEEGKPAGFGPARCYPCDWRCKPHIRYRQGDPLILSEE